MKPDPSPSPGLRVKPRHLIASLLCLALLCWTGCRIVRHTASVPAKTMAVFFPGGKADQPEVGDLQRILMQFADSYTADTVKSVDELTGVPGSPFTLRTALVFKIASVGGALSIAAGPNPYANLFDMTSVVTLNRMVLQDHWATRTNGVLFEPWLRRTRALETNIWSIAGQILTPAQQEELHQAIAEFYKTHPDLADVPFRPREAAFALPRSVSKKGGQAALFSLSALDPFASLDPAVREITESRLFAERAMFTVQRMPWILRWQTELTLLDAADQPHFEQALKDATSLAESADRASRAAETISQVAEELPGQVSAERKAILDALEQQESQLNALFKSGTAFSDSLGVTVTNFDALMKRFGVGVPDTNAPPPDPDAKPFDILDYARTADQITAMAKELNVTINELNTTLDSPALDRLSNQTTSDARGLMNHAFLLAAGLVVLGFLCAVIYRFAASRRGR